MKLRNITEAKSKTPLRDAANQLGVLVKYIQTNYKKEDEVSKALDTFLKYPSAKSWVSTKWIIDNISRNQFEEPAAKANLKQILSLKSYTPHTIAAASYDMEPKDLNGTPRRKFAMNKPDRDKLKKAMGPEGYVTTFSDLSDSANTRQIKNILKNSAKNGPVIQKSLKKDFPWVKPLKKF